MSVSLTQSGEGRWSLDRNFGKLWAALSVSQFGSQITMLALPLYAAVSLHANAFEMGVLSSLGQLPYLLCSLPAGLVVDRVRRRPLLVACDMVSALALITIPLGQVLGVVRFWELCAVSFVVGTASVFSEVAHYSYTPTLVGRSHLTAANSRLQVSYSVAESAGPGAGGLLVQWLTAPFAVVVDAASYLVSGLLLHSIRDHELQPERAGPPISATVMDGMRALLGHRLLRPIVLTSIFVALFEDAVSALYVVWAIRDLHLNAAMIGLVFVLGGLGALPGAMLAPWAGERVGIGPAIAFGLFGSALAVAALPFVHGRGLWAVVWLGAAKAFGALVFTIANIHQWSLRQAVTPDRIAGRVTAAQRFLVYGSGSLGGLGGGAIGVWLGLRPALIVCAVGATLSPLITLFSPVRTLRRQPDRAPEAAQSTPERDDRRLSARREPGVASAGLQPASRPVQARQQDCRRPGRIL